MVCVYNKQMEVELNGWWCITIAAKGQESVPKDRNDEESVSL